MPPIFSTISKYLENDFILSCRDPIPEAINKNGKARPSEKTDNNKAPCQMVDVVDASIRIDPKIGPTQGVHPNANERRRRNELKGLPFLKIGESWILFILFKKEKLNTFNKNKPKKITNSPPIFVSQYL